MPILALILVENIMKRITFILSTTLLFIALPFSSAHAIKKCQDAEGKWHYGDISVAQCSKSKVTTLNDRGFIESEKDAPKTEEQIQQEKQASELADAEAANIRAKQDERNRILSVYETEADIDRQRDNQIDSVASNIAVHRAYLKSVGAKIERLKAKSAGLTKWKKENNLKQITEAEARIQESSTELEKLVKQKVLIMERFDREKKIYLELKRQA